MSTHARIYSASACAGSSPCTGLPRMVRDSCLHAWSRTPSIPSILAAGVVYRARTVKPSHMSPPRGQSLPAATHSEAVSYSCNAALAVGISFLVGCNPKLVCPGDADAIQRRYSASFWRYTDAMMLLRVGSWPKPGLIPTPSPLSVVSSPRHAILPSLRNFNVVNRPCLAPETTLTNVLYIIF